MMAWPLCVCVCVSFFLFALRVVPCTTLLCVCVCLCAHLRMRPRSHGADIIKCTGCKTFDGKAMPAGPLAKRFFFSSLTD